MEFEVKNREDTWTYWSYLKNGTKNLSFHTADFKLGGRWQIRGEFPKDEIGQINTTYNQKWPEITVSMEKSPEKIARDIQSRIMPEYEKQLDDVIERNENNNKYHAGRMAQICKVADFLKAERPKNDDRAVVYPGDSGKGVHRIEAHSEDRVKFEIQVEADKAIEILKILGY